jgi:hypothetical protein
MEVTRWRRDQGDKLTNYVLLQTHLAKKLDEVNSPEEVQEFDAEVIQKIDKRIQQYEVIGEKYRLH